jgi:ATP-dependent RNA helicase DeaD
VSTDVAARGIDVPDISTVVHVDPPRNSDSYIHRSGRTGRAGRTGTSVLLVAGPESRKVTRMLQVARIDVSWQPVPKPENVQKALLKRARKEMHARLVEDAPTEAQLMYAKQLIEERDPIQVVATLLEMAKPKPPRDPMNVVGLDPFADNRPKQRGGRGAAQDARPGAHVHGAVNGGGPTARGPRTGAFTQFSVNWGEQTGATPSRLLSHVCRRGGLESHQVGSIQITAKSSTVDIASDAADEFEKSARRPDRRDPEIMIRRDEKGKSPSAKPWAKPGTKPWAKPGTKPGIKGSAAGGSTPPAGAAREPRRPNAKRPGRPVHLKRKNPRRTASR